jgi:multisubunit Na+/H+ antiporter MnhB subunit
LSLIVLLFAIVALYGRSLAGAWRGTYVITASVALYFNFFVFIVQSFEKVPALKAIAPTQASPVFGLTQLVVLAIFVVLTVLAFKRFRGEPPAISSSAEFPVRGATGTR